MSPQYTTPHYVLMVASAAVLALFVAGIIYLLIREKQKMLHAKKEHIQSLLRRRRKAFSAAPRKEGAPPSSPSPVDITQVPQVQITTSFYSFPTRLVAGPEFQGKDSIAPL
ncbi:hypothetical protein ElyMa_005229100 [Elysia marginata]|uniref:Uncharacterized protein n=1 Tax=Elysia marginata TaxID=1093978 RepID=A0AAV4K1Y2_9GAST|nr:hypothetical protein ElyMa_005229100 [Elysia marginata]